MECRKELSQQICLTPHFSQTVFRNQVANHHLPLRADLTSVELAGPPRLPLENHQPRKGMGVLGAAGWLQINNTYSTLDSLWQWFSECGVRPATSASALPGNWSDVNSQVPPQILWIRNSGVGAQKCVLTCLPLAMLMDTAAWDPRTWWPPPPDLPEVNVGHSV